jgi:putative ABC transport system permease protein
VVLVGTWFDYPVIQSEEEEFRTGVRSLNPTWKLEGSWIEDFPATQDEATAVVGTALARRLHVALGDALLLTPSLDRGSQQSEPLRLTVKGILTTGGAEDDQVLLPLKTVQSLAGLEDKVRRVHLSALIKPEDALSRTDPKAMTREEYDRWYCSPYISSILHQIGEVLPGTTGRAIRQVAETQGNVLGKLGFLMGALAILALAAAALSISSLASLNVMERRQEIGLMQALGARSWLVSGFLLTEMAALGLAGGMVGFFAGHLLAGVLGGLVFDAQVNLHWMGLPVIILIAVTVSCAGAWGPISRAVGQAPAMVLRGD